MATIDILPAVPARAGDAEHALSGGGDGASCQCQWWMVRASTFSNSTREERVDWFRAQLASDTPPGLVAYVDGEAAGWVKVSPRPQQPRLARTRTLQQSPEPFDDPDVWAITCFVVRREHRREGVATALLDAAVDYARTHGARVVEGYPLDTDVRKATANELFHGALSTFAAAGFTEVARPAPNRPIVSLTC